MCENEVAMYLFQLFQYRIFVAHWNPLIQRIHQPAHDKCQLQIEANVHVSHCRFHEQTIKYLNKDLIKSYILSK